MRPISVLLIVALGGVCLAAEPKPASTPPGKEPTYEGKSLSQWTTLAKDKDPKLRMQAAGALEQIGPAAAALAELLKDDDAGVRRAATESLVRICRAAVPTLNESFQHKDSKARWAPFESVRKIGPAAVAVFVELLKDNEPQVRLAAAVNLGEMGPTPRQPFPTSSSFTKTATGWFRCLPPGPWGRSVRQPCPP